MGEVYLAYDERLDRQVAIKRIRRDRPLSVTQLRRFRREARAAARLSHPALVRIYDLLTDESGDAIVMEYLEGEALSALAARGPLAMELAARLGSEIAQGLAAVHAAGLVHRDLKTDNVILTTSGLVKVLDFGIARSLLRDESGEELLTGEGLVIGTLHTMAPEQVRGEQADVRSDLFSLGVLLYELLTGRSPFRGTSGLDSLQRVLAHRPEPLATMRDGVPRELSTLVEQLLAKDPAQRPRSAREVALALCRIAANAAHAAPAESATPVSIGDLPTDLAPLPGAGAGAPPPQPGARRAPRARAALLAAAAAVLVAGALAAALLLARPAVRPLRVAVLPPVVRPAGDRALELAGSGVLTTVLSRLASLHGLAPVDPLQLAPGAAPDSPLAAARTLSAAEVLTSTLERQGTMGRLSMVRAQASDGRVLWSQTFLVPIDEQDLRLLADAVAVELRRAYPEHLPRPGVPDLEVKDQDYAEFLRLAQRLASGEARPGPEIDQLEGIVRRSPRFLEGYLLAAWVYESLFRTSGDPRYLARAEALARRAAALAPGDPRPLVRCFTLALDGHRPREAERLLADVAQRQPGDPSIPLLASQLAEERGDLARAVADMRKAVRWAPAWKNLYRLADLEAKNGEVDESRSHFAQLLAASPRNLFALTMQAQMEMMYGDPARAEALYQDLQRIDLSQSHLSNLGLARLLLGRYAEAAATFAKALELDPHKTSAILNLADAEAALEHRGRAAELYGQALATLRERPQSELSPHQLMDEAQCLANLGRAPEAAVLARLALQRHPRDPEVLYTAALVYTLAGERAAAVRDARLALAAGLQPRWFSLPAYRALADEPEIRLLLGKAPRARAAAAPPDRSRDRPSGRPSAAPAADSVRDPAAGTR